MAQQQKKEPDLNQLLKVRREKLAQLQEEGKDPFQIMKYDVSHHSQEIKDDFDGLEGKSVTIAGRLMSKRVMGKASFCNIQDLQGSIQVYAARDDVGEESYKDFKIVTFDSTDATTRAVEQEIVEATIVQNPREMGIRAMDVMYPLFEEGLGEVEDQYVDVMVVDKENVQDVSYIRREDIPWQLY